MFSCRGLERGGGSGLAAQLLACLTAEKHARPCHGKKQPQEVVGQRMVCDLISF